MGKPPFEKVRSLVERRKLFEALLMEKAEILCKSNDDQLFHFKPAILAGDTVLEGWFSPPEKKPEMDTHVVGNFSVGSEKYFFHAPMRVKGTEGSFDVSCDVYRLQRRAALRLNIPLSFEMYIAITEFQGKPQYTVAHISDISSGGARIFFASTEHLAQGQSINPGLRVGDRFQCILRTNSKRNLDLVAEVRHCHSATFLGEVIEQFGIQFVELTPLLQNRLVGMTLDLQQRLVKEGS